MRILAISIVVVLAAFLISESTIRGAHAEAGTSPIPRVVAEQSFVHQTTDLPDTAIFTPSNDGDFLVAITVMGNTPVNAGGQYCASLTWKDEFFLRRYPQVPQIGDPTRPLCDGAAPTPQVVPIHAIAGTPITVQVQYSPPGILGVVPQYDLYVKVISY